jgi:2-oxoglutarate ferredoxin oxidoreductase subunit alpha
MPTRTQQSDLLLAPMPATATPSTCCCCPKIPKASASSWRAGVRPRRPAADARLRHARSRYRHERVAVRAVQVGRQRKLDRGKVMTPRIWRPARTSAAISTSMATAFRTAPIPARIPTKGASSRAAPRATAARYTEEGRRLQDNMERLLKKFETAKTLVPGPVRKPGQAQSRRARRDLLRLDQPGDGRGAGALEAQGIHVDALRVRAFPFARSVIDFIAAHDECSSSSRTATRSCARC